MVQYFLLLADLLFLVLIFLFSHDSIADLAKEFVVGFCQIKPQNDGLAYSNHGFVHPV
jgi:hypothetical protein